MLCRWKCWGLDVVVFLFAISFIAAASYGFVPGYRQGFYCTDLSLRYPYRGDTVSITCMLLIGVILPFAYIICVDGITYRIVLMWIGLLFSVVIMEATKLMTGRLRPHFWDSCKPKVDNTACAKGYVTKFQCTTSFLQIIQHQPFASFPSAHALLTAYGMTFFVLYLQKRFHHGFISLLFRAVVQTACVLWTTFCSVSRITDHRHHVEDVIAGVLIGFGIAIVAFHYRIKPKMNKLSTIPTAPPAPEVHHLNQSCDLSVHSTIKISQI